MSAVGTASSRSPAFSLAGYLLAALCLLAGSAAVAGPDTSVLRIEVYRGGRAHATLTLDHEPAEAGEQRLQAALERLFPGIDTEYLFGGDGPVTARGRCRLLTRRGLSASGALPLGPLLAALRKSGYDELGVQLVLPQFPVAECSAGPLEPGPGSGKTQCTVHVPTTLSAFTVRCAVSYRPVDLARPLWPLLVVLLLPVLPAAALVRLGRRQETEPTAAWFGYVRLLQAFPFYILLWVGSAYAGGAADLLSFLGCGLPSFVGLGLLGLAGLLPPMLWLVALGVLSHPLQQRLRGAEVSRREITLQMMATLGYLVVPIVLWMAFVGAVADYAARPAALLAVAAVVSALVFRGLRISTSGLMPHAVASGELRDRIFAMATRLGVALNQIYVLPAYRMRMANAFAVRGGNVLITDYLVEHLSRRELEAIAAHELVHLKRGHPARLGLLLWGLFALLGLGAVWAAPLIGIERDAGVPGWLAAAGLAAAMLLRLLVGRRYEHIADCEAAALTGDPEAVITALARLSRLSLLPLQWSRLTEAGITHPSTLRRVRAVARRHGVTPLRLAELLDSLPEPIDRYLLPPAVLASDTVFSSVAKQREGTVLSWTVASLVGVVPCLVLLLARALPPLPGGMLLPSLVALVTNVLLLVAVVNRLAMRRMPDYCRRLQAKLEAEGIPVAAHGGRFTGLAPGPYARLYEGNTCWDLGFLFMTAEGLCYVGEQTRFRLTADRVVGVVLWALWLDWWPRRRPHVVFRDNEGRLSVLQLAPLEARSMRQVDRSSAALTDELQRWAASPCGVAAPPVLLELPPPGLPEVTSANPRTLGTLQTLRRLATLWLFVSLAAAMLLGLPFSVDGGAPACLAALVTLLTAVAYWRPFRRYRDRPLPLPSGMAANAEPPAA